MAGVVALTTSLLKDTGDQSNMNVSSSTTGNQCLNCQKGVDDYIKIYNSVRPHQSLGYLTSDEVYKKGCFLEEIDKTSNKVA